MKEIAVSSPMAVSASCECGWESKYSEPGVVVVDARTHIKHGKKSKCEVSVNLVQKIWAK